MDSVCTSNNPGNTYDSNVQTMWSLFKMINKKTLPRIQDLFHWKDKIERSYTIGKIWPDQWALVENSRTGE